MNKTLMKSPSPIVIDETNLSRAWAHAFLHILDHPGKEISPLILSITNFSQDGKSPEDVSVRDNLDRLLLDLEMRKIEDVAYTIFPQRLWVMAQGDRAKLFQFYKLAFPRYKTMEPISNRHGLYFERLTMYGSGPCDGNQLEWIISQYKPGVRHSMFQATTFDPSRDHVNLPRLGFPCLQHVTFEPTKNGLITNAFYATQQIFNKAYGNYLGLAQLGAFMAHEMGMPLVRLNVMVGVAKLGEIAKTTSKLDNIVKFARLCVQATEPKETQQMTGT